MWELSKYLGLPLDASSHGAELDHMLGLVHWLMLLLFVGWGIFFIYTLIRFRQSKHPTADYRGVKGHLSSYQEVAVVVAEAILLIGFAFPAWASLKNDFPPRGEALEINVIAEQFAWNIQYSGDDGVFGKRDPHLVDTQLNPIGLDRSDPAAADDIVTVNELHLPVNRPVIINLTSKDVIHSFSLPVMRVKQDAIPGIKIPIWFKPVKTGEFEIACAQLCGLGHYRMRGYLTIESPEEFQEWLKSIAEENQEALGLSLSN